MKKRFFALLTAALLLLCAALAHAEPETAPDSESEDSIINFTVEDALREHPGKIEELPELGISFYLPEGFAATQTDVPQDHMVGFYRSNDPDCHMEIYVIAFDRDASWTNDAIMSYLEDEIGECSSGVFVVNGREAVVARGANDYQDENDEEILTTELAVFSPIGEKIVGIIVREMRDPAEDQLGVMVISSMAALDPAK